MNDSTRRTEKTHPTFATALFLLAIALTAISAMADDPPAAKSQATVQSARFSDKGLSIGAGTMGNFTLEYPVLSGDDNKTHKPIEVRPSGNQSTVKYDGGMLLKLSFDKGQLAMTFSNIPGSIKKFRMDMQLGFGWVNGGKYKVAGQDEKPFPAEKPDKPHLFQGNATSITLTNHEGKTLQFGLPDYSYLQLQDNREWGWKMFHMMFMIPYNPGHKVHAIRIGGQAGDGKSQVLVDDLGQNATMDWPQKVKSVAELLKDVEAEKAYYDSLNPPQWDTYGGLPGSGQKLGLKKTGFFHVEKKGERWILVDPEGNAFFHLGICCFGPAAYTYVEGRREQYAWLPPVEGEYRTAWGRDNYWSRTAISFHLANMIRKYGQPMTPETFTEHMIPRVRKFGFNSGGAFSSGRTDEHVKRNFSYVSHLPIQPWSGIPFLGSGVRETFDPFDEKIRQRIDQNFAKSVASRADDPLVIGYYLSNEPLHENVVKLVPTLNGKFACKRRLVQMLQEKYRTIEAFRAAWGIEADSFEALNDKGLAVKTKQAFADMQAYHELFFETYFQLIAETFRKYDRNHMLIGNRWQSGTINNEQLCRIAGKYMDVISFNYYTYGLDKAFLDRIYRWTGGRPMFFSEFYWNSPADSGLPGGVKDISSQEQRGLAYRNYVEQAAKMNYVVGIEWFTLVDCHFTGQWFSRYGGENPNSGLFDVADRPWKEMIAHMVKTNYAIYDVWLGDKPAFVFDDPRFNPKAAAMQTTKIHRATAAMKIDGDADGWPGIPATRISSQRLVNGADAGEIEASFKLCWDDENLYLLADVTDHTPMRNEKEADRLWMGDGLELFVGHEKIDAGGALLFDDRQVLLGAGGGGRHYILNAPQQCECRLAVVAHVDGKGYTLEAAIPFKALNFAPAEGLRIRLDLAVDDSTDGKGRKCQLMWNGTARNSGDRTYWGQAVFVR